MIDTLFPKEKKISDHTIPNLGLMLTLMGTCKMVARLFKERVIMLLRLFLSFDIVLKASPTRVELRFLNDVERFCQCVGVVLDDQKEKKNVDLRVYLRRCLEDALYHTPAHLSNCVSLLRLACGEGNYLYKEKLEYRVQQSRITYTYKPLTFMNTSTKHAHTYLRDLKYFRQESKTAVCVYRMKNVTVMEGFKYGTPSAYDRTQPTNIYSRAKDILAKKGDTHKLALLEKYGNVYDGYEWVKYAVNTIADAGELVETKKATVEANVHAIIVMINERQHYIFSDDPAVVAFRARCFKSCSTVEEATQRYILNSKHVRNWENVYSKGRYTV